MRANRIFEVNLELNVYPVLHLARKAIALEAMLAEIDAIRQISPELDERLKHLGLLTCYGESVADDADAAILGATDLLEAHQNGPFYVVAPAPGG